MRFNESCSIFCSRKLILSAYLKIFKPCGYFLRIEKTQGNSGKFKITQGRFFDSKSGNPVQH